MRKLLGLLVGILCVFQANSQNNVGIGTNSPSPNALLHLENGASNLGLLLPNVDHLVFTPSGTDIGMMIFDDTENKVYTWDGTNWISSTSEWGLNGNDIYNLNSGNVGIGTMTPVSRLHVQNTTSVSSQRGSMMSYSNNNSNSNAIVAVGNNNGLPTGFVYSRAHLAGYGQGPATLGLVDYGVWGHVPNGTWGVLASNGADSLLPNTYAALSGINYSALLMGGNVGIGNTAPLAQLSVATASNLAFQVDGSSNVGTWLSINNSGTGGEWFHLINTATGNGDAGELSFHTGSDGGTATGLIMSLNHASQNVGIGRTQAWAPLHFATNTANRKIVLWQAADNEHEYYGFGVNSNTLRYQVPSTIDRHVFFAGSSTTSSNELMRIQGNGNVGIGTASPFSTLSVNGSITVDHGDANVGDFQTGLKFGAGNTGEVIASNRSAGVNQFGIDFYTGYANRMAITTLGNVGIGTANPLSTLEVNGSIRLSNGAPRQIIMTPEPNGNDAQSLQIKASDATSGPQARNGGSLILDGGHNYNISIAGSRPGHVFLRSGGNLFTGGNSPPGDIYFQSGGVSVAANTYTNRAMIQGSTGFMGINTLTPLFHLHVNGLVAGVGPYINLSDKRFKKDVEKINQPLNKILTLEGVYYSWDNSLNPELNIDDKRHLGFLAQDLEKILPSVVHTSNDALNTKTVEYSSIIPVLVEAMKEQQALIESLKKENESIKEQNSQFELRLNSLEVSLPSN